MTDELLETLTGAARTVTYLPVDEPVDHKTGAKMAEATFEMIAPDVEALDVDEEARTSTASPEFTEGLEFGDGACGAKPASAEVLGRPRPTWVAAQRGS